MTLVAYSKILTKLTFVRILIQCKPRWQETCISASAVESARMLQPAQTLSVSWWKTLSVVLQCFHQHCYCTKVERFPLRIQFPLQFITSPTMFCTSITWKTEQPCSANFGTCFSDHWCNLQTLSDYSMETLIIETHKCTNFWLLFSDREGCSIQPNRFYFRWSKDAVNVKL